ncbi:ABC transporter substrate-binding protein [Nocardioides sp. CFH 31398]|uniref:ABC transporter substrate-binding protein n=1 Tax=Nocardioides sp. CFH 31398 TaxID=2919579 RepID=UPI001F061135|nr:ABC transporter substrate-binding protein [Nocardioides sp. CFH 31398]MCH1864998.1 ABC transporter substrate-binding protein [Nocardioides sp. CFH 31398]
MRRTRSTYLLAASALLAGATLTACGSDDGGSGGDPLSGGGGDGDTSTITVGSANFPENELLMQMYGQALEDAGVDVEYQPNIGAREVYLEAFENGEIDLLPEYNGALLSYLIAPDLVPEDVTDPDQVYDALQDVLPEGSQTLPQSEAEDKDTLTVTQETAEEYDLASIADLEPVADQLVVGAGPEFEERFQGLVGLEEVYGLQFEEFRALDAGGPLTKEALESGDIDVANIFSTDSAITENDWVVLEDPENLYLAQNIVPLIQSEAVTPEVEEALNAVSEALTTENLTEYLAMVQLDNADPSVVAEQFLNDEGVTS